MYKESWKEHISIMQKESIPNQGLNYHPIGRSVEVQGLDGEAGTDRLA